MSRLKAFARAMTDTILVIALVVIAAIAVYSLFGDVAPNIGGAQ